MNKINNLEELFKKYKYFTDFNKNGNLKFDKEVEIKINNPNEECNCELCKSEIACMNKIIELNKSKIMGVNIESLCLKGQKNITNKNEDDLIYNKSNRKTYPPKSPRSSSANKKDSIKFSSSKIKESSKEAYGSISKEKKESSSNKKKRSSSEKEKIENEDIKIDEFLKEKMYKNDEKDDTSDEENQKKKRKKKKEKSKSKSRSRKNEKDSDSEEKETKSKYNKKKKKNKKKKNEKKDSESEEEEIETKKYKKKIRYPKD
jgi:bifunctional autolysin